MSSVVNGHSGASSFAIVSRLSYNAPCAAGSESFQNRDRDRRTYQFERSSTKRSSAWAARKASYPSSASVTSPTVRCRRERIQRSTTCSTRPAWSGAHPSRFAYVTKKEYVFQSVSRNRLVASSMPASETRRVVHGDPEEKKYQRNASAPRVSRISHGSMTLPRDLDIFCPSPATISARHTTLRYGARSNTSPLTARSE